MTYGFIGSFIGSNSSFATVTAQGLKTCQSFNYTKRRNKRQFSFTNVSNRIVGSQACDQSHPGYWLSPCMTKLPYLHLLSYCRSLEGGTGI